MRKISALVAVLSACGQSDVVAPWTIEGPSVVTTISQFKGLWTQPGQIGTVPPGAMLQADNVVITNDGLVETRRGTSIIASKAMTKLLPYRGQFVGHDRATGLLSYGDATSTTWTDYSGTFSAPTYDQIRAAALNSNLYFTTSGVPYRLDALAGTPEPVGISDALDVQAVLTTAAGSALPGNTQTAYRVVFGKRDANGMTILGSPSGRYVIASPSVLIGIGSLVRSGTTVTATLSSGVTNPFLNGETIYLTPGETNFPAGEKTLTGVTPTTVTFTESGAATSSTSTQTIQYQTRDANLIYSIPAGLPTGAFVQAYRSQPSSAASVDPGDELGLVYEGSAFPVVRTVGRLIRTVSSVVTATTSVPHGYTTGMLVRVSPGGTVPGVGTTHAAVGFSSACATSTDGVTWVAQTIPTGAYSSVVWNGSVFIAVGSSVASTSPDGVTWTARTIPAGGYTSVAWNGEVAVAVGTAGAVATSPDGITWTVQDDGGRSFYAVAWSGFQFVAVGDNWAGTSPDGIAWTSRSIPAGFYYALSLNGTTFVACGASGRCATSVDGVTWVAQTIPSGDYYGVAWNGSLFAAVGNYRVATSPDGVTWTGRSIPAGFYRAVQWSASGFIAVGDGVAATSADGLTWSSSTIPSGNYSGVVVGGTGTVSFAPGEYTITGTPGASSFTYTETGSNGILVEPQVATPLTGAIIDQTPAYFIGAALYTNPGQQGMAGAASKPWGARDVAAWRETAFYANITYPSSADLYLLAVSDGTSGGIRAGDVVTINGISYTASATTESISDRTFKVSTSTSAATRLFETAQSLIRIINRTSANTITAQDTSSSTDPGPRIHVQENNTSTTLSVSFTGDAASWSVANLVGPEQRLNELRWSSLQQPDVLPLLNYKRIGDASAAILRIVPTRNALYVLKEDGVWLVSGYSSPWSIDPFDPTIKLVAPESAAVLDNQIYCLARNGVMRISDTGVTVVSRPIENIINDALNPTMRSVTAAYAFGIADERDHKYYLWIPTASTDTTATKAYVYDMFTDAWTARTDAMSHGVSNPADDRLYFVDGTSVRQERKDYQPTDLADETYAVTISSGAGTTSLVLADATNALVGDVVAQAYVFGVITAKNGSTVTLDRAAALSNGAATVYRAISTAIAFAPKFGADPSVSYRFREVALLFRDIYFAAATIGYSTDWYPTWASITASGPDYGWTGVSFPVVVPTEAAQTALALRSLVDGDHGRGNQLLVRWQHAQAWSPMRLQALNVIVTPVSQRVGR